MTFHRPKNPEYQRDAGQKADAIKMNKSGWLYLKRRSKIVNSHTKLSYSDLGRPTNLPL